MQRKKHERRLGWTAVRRKRYVKIARTEQDPSSLNQRSAEGGHPEIDVDCAEALEERESLERALNDSQRLNRAVSDTLPDGLVRLDRQWQAVFTNPAGERLYYLAQEALATHAGRSAQVYSVGSHGQNAEWAALWKRLTELVFLSGESAQLEFEIHGPEGRRAIEARCVPELAEGGKAQHVLTLLRDVTGRKRAEEALRGSEDRFRVALSHAGMAVFSQDLELRYTWVSERPPRLLKDFAPGKTDYDLYSPEDASRFDALKREVIDTGQGQRAELQVNVQGERRWYELVVEPLRDEGGKATGILGSAMDLTERRRLQAENERQSAMLTVQTELLERQNTLLSAVLDADPGGLAVLEGERLEHIFFNPAYHAMLPHPELDPKGQAFQQVWRREEGLRGEWLIRQTRRSGKPLHIERYPQLYPDGTTRVFTLDARKLPWDGGGAVLLVLRDVTEVDEIYRKAESAAAQAHEYARRLERSNQELQSFAFVASHDLQEPLRKIQAFGDRLKANTQDTLGDKELDYLNRMQSAAIRMNSMIQGLLSYSRISTKAKPFEPVDLRQIVDETLQDLETRLEREGGKVVVGDLPTIEADPLQMRQLFQNLIANALKFHHQDIRPVVKVYSETISGQASFARKQARIVVEDNGVGFDERNMNRLFQPFERLHGRSEFEGAGIGLAICRKIVERHDGSITAVSQVGEGSRFLVTLPYRHYGEG